MNLFTVENIAQYELDADPQETEFRQAVDQVIKKPSVALFSDSVRKLYDELPGAFPSKRLPYLAEAASYLIPATRSVGEKTLCAIFFNELEKTSPTKDEQITILFQALDLFKKYCDPTRLIYSQCEEKLRALGAPYIKPSAPQEKGSTARTASPNP